LSDHGLNPEEWGGTTLYANVSAKRRVGIKELLELILLQADVLELKANPTKLARARFSRHGWRRAGPRGHRPGAGREPQGGDPIVTGSHYGACGRWPTTREAHGCGRSRHPVEIQGLSGLPDAGQKFAVLKDERTPRQIALHRGEKDREKAVVRPRMSLEELHKRIDAGEVKDLNIIIKSDVQGSMELSSSPSPSSPATR